MTWSDMAIAAFKGATYTLCIWSALWLFSAPDHHPNANWFFVWISYLMGFWGGRPSQ